jgi:hypothetical protein
VVYSATGRPVRGAAPLTDTHSEGTGLSPRGGQWTTEQLKQLVTLPKELRRAGLNGAKPRTNWKAVGTQLGRSNRECCVRWTGLRVSGDLEEVQSATTGPWSEEDMSRLDALVAQCGSHAVDWGPGGAHSAPHQAGLQGQWKKQQSVGTERDSEPPAQDAAAVRDAEELVVTARQPVSTVRDVSPGFGPLRRLASGPSRSEASWCD